MEEKDESFSMTTNLILPSSFPLYQSEKNEVVRVKSIYLWGITIWYISYYTQESITTGSVGLKSLTISSINKIDLMELRVSLQ